MLRRLQLCLLLGDLIPLHPHTLLDDKLMVHATSAGNAFRHFFQLGIQHTYRRAEEATLGVSFNAQSQAPDIPDISSQRCKGAIHPTLSLNSTKNDPVISSLPLRPLKQELSAALNAHSQAPEDPVHALDSQCATRDSFYPSPFFSQVLQRFPTRISTAPL